MDSVSPNSDRLIDRVGFRLQLRFDVDSILIRLRFDCSSTAYHRHKADMMKHISGHWPIIDYAHSTTPGKWTCEFNNNIIININMNMILLIITVKVARFG